MLQGMRKCKNVFFVALVGAALAAATVNLSPAADHVSDCRKRIHVAEEKLQKAIDKHGEHSPEADRRRHDLEQAHRDCADVH
jgi:histidinol-phosphate/aromatic aminotransferase/cobyric acid decarboxylase-like protein